jgi:hypothetical protein
MPERRLLADSGLLCKQYMIRFDSLNQVTSELVHLIF